MKNAYFPQLTLEQLNALITAAATRMREKAELYDECKKSGHLASAQDLYKQYIELKGAILQLENARFLNIETMTEI